MFGLTGLLVFFSPPNPIEQYMQVGGRAGISALSDHGLQPYFVLFGAALLLASMGWLLLPGRRRSSMVTGAFLLATSGIYLVVAFLPESYQFRFNAIGDAQGYSYLSFLPLAMLTVAGVFQALSMLAAYGAYRVRSFVVAAGAIFLWSLLNYLIVNIRFLGPGLQLSSFLWLDGPLGIDIWIAVDLASLLMLFAGLIAAYCFLTPHWRASSPPGPLPDPPSRG